ARHDRVSARGDRRFRHRTFLLELVERYREGVAGLHIACVEASLQPPAPLVRRAVRPALAIDAAGGFGLDPVIAYRLRRGDRLLQVAHLEDSALVRGMSPDAGEAIGL